MQADLATPEGVDKLYDAIRARAGRSMRCSPMQAAGSGMAFLTRTRRLARRGGDQHHRHAVT